MKVHPFIAIAAVGCFFSIPALADAVPAKKPILISQPLRSARSLLESSQNDKRASAIAKLCANGGNADVQRAIEVDKKLTEARAIDPLKPAEAAAALKAQGATNVPSPAELGKADTTSKLAAAKTELVKTLDKERTSLRSAIGSAIAKESGTPCDEVCRADALNQCKNGLREPGKAGEESALLSAGAGISWQGAVATGLADFLKSRAEAELVLWISSAFQDKLCKGSQERRWFKNTCELVDDMKRVDAPPAGVLVAAALRKDLESIPWQLVQKLTALDDQNIAVLTAFVEKLRQGDSPLGIFAGLQKASELTQMCTGGQPGERNREFACGTILVSKLIEISGDVLREGEDGRELSNVVTAIRDYATKACKADDAALCKAIKDDTDGRKLAAMVNAVSALNQKLIGWTTKGADTKVRSDEIARELLYLSFETGSAAVEMTGNLKLKEAWSFLRTGLDAVGAVSRADYVEGFAVILKLSVQQNALPKNVAQYVPLIIDLASAKTSAEVEGALNAAAAPVGSWRVKRRQFTVSASGMVGAGGGFEMPTRSAAFGTSGVGSVTASVGIDFSGPTGNGWTQGLYVSILDVGQLVSVPLAINPSANNDEGKKSKPVAGSDIQLAQVLSPGLFYRVGLGESPLTFGVGAAWAPVLRKYEFTTLDDKPLGSDFLSVVRFGAFLAVDVTILPF